jgi:hypothetical protein
MSGRSFFVLWANYMNINTYSTKDLYEAAYLYALDCQLLRLDKVGTSFFFVFQPFDKCEQLRNEYWSKSGLAVPKLYADAIRALKERIFANPK